MSLDADGNAEEVSPYRDFLESKYINLLIFNLKFFLYLEGIKTLLYILEYYFTFQNISTLNYVHLILSQRPRDPGNPD